MCLIHLFKHSLMNQHLWMVPAQYQCSIRPLEEHIFDYLSKNPCFICRFLILGFDPILCHLQEKNDSSSCNTMPSKYDYFSYSCKDVSEKRRFAQALIQSCKQLIVPAAQEFYFEREPLRIFMSSKVVPFRMHMSRWLDTDI